MIPATVHKEIEIKAPIARVWDFIGTDDGLRQWWQTDIVLEARAGGRFEESSVLQGEVCIRRGIVTTYEPPRQLTLTFSADEDGDGLSVITLSITLEEVGEATRVTVTHQLFGAVAIQAHDESSSHGDTTTPTPRVPDIINQLEPMGSTPFQGWGPVYQTTIGVKELEATMQEGLYQRLWTQRLEGLARLTSTS